MLGGTGYVAGELLRLIAGHPHLEAGRHPVGQPAGRVGGEGLPPPAPVYPDTKFASLEEIEAAGSTPAAQRDLLGRAARRLGAR